MFITDRHIKSIVRNLTKKLINVSKFILKAIYNNKKKVIFYFKLAFSKFPTDSPTTQTQTEVPQKLQTQTQYPTSYVRIGHQSLETEAPILFGVCVCVWRDNTVFSQLCERFFFVFKFAINFNMTRRSC